VGTTARRITLGHGSHDSLRRLPKTGRGRLDAEGTVWAARGLLVKELDPIENAGHRQNGPNWVGTTLSEFPGRCNIVLRQVQTDLSWTVGSSCNHH
jgi:hypothetical protein